MRKKTFKMICPNQLRITSDCSCSYFVEHLSVVVKNGLSWSMISSGNYLSFIDQANSMDLEPQSLDFFADVSTQAACRDNGMGQTQDRVLL